jgi:AraC-like DNA-binding protein
VTSNALHLLTVGASVGLSLAILIQVGVDRGIDRRLRLLIAGTATAGAFHSLLVSQLPWPPVVFALCRAVACAGVPLLWLVVHAIFRDEFRLRPWHLALVGTMAVAGALPLAGGEARFASTAYVTSVATVLALDALRLLITGRAEDLDERRRAVRLLLAAVGPGLVLVVLAARLFVGGEARSTPPTLTVVATLAVKAAWLVLTLSATAGLHSLLRSAPAPAPIAQPLVPLRRAPPKAGEPGVSDRVMAAMTEQHLYRRPRLQVSDLARHLDVPEYRVRAAIIEELGYRNFPSFVARFRLQEVASRLRRPEDAHLPILTLALDAGFASIGPFNRAFRDAYGMAPTAYRARPAPEAPTATPPR